MIKDFEEILVGDCSTDNTLEITSLVCNFMLEILQKKNLERENEQIKIILINLQKHIEESKVI